MSTAEVLVDCRNAARTFGVGATAVVAVHGATCQVRAGDRIAVTGPSGSGKSTLLHLLAALEEPTSGTVDRHGLTVDRHGLTVDRHGLTVDRHGLADGIEAHRTGVVFQGPSLIPALDVAENAALPLVLAGVPDEQARSRALDALALVGAADLAAKLPEEISGGQSQRVAVARVLALRPRLVLADEPTGQLDQSTGRHIVDVLIAAADEIGAALVVTTHDPAVAERFAERWEMHEGRLRPARGPSARARGTAPTGDTS